MESGPSYSIFSVTDCRDKILMLVGTIGAIGNGLSNPLMALIFGNLVNAFGQSQAKNIVQMVSEVYSQTNCFHFSHCSFASDIKTNCRFHSNLCTWLWGVDWLLFFVSA